MESASMWPASATSASEPVRKPPIASATMKPPVSAAAISTRVLSVAPWRVIVAMPAMAVAGVIVPMLSSRSSWLCCMLPVYSACAALISSSRRFCWPSAAKLAGSSHS